MLLYHQVQLRAQRLIRAWILEFSESNSASYLLLFRGRQLRRKTFLLTIAWVANCIVYVAIAYNVKNLGGNFHVTWVLQSAVEAPATLLNLLIVDR